MYHLSENVTIYDVFRLCNEKLIPDGLVILEIKGGSIRELWPKGDHHLLDVFHDGTEQV